MKKRYLLITSLFLALLLGCTLNLYYDAVVVSPPLRTNYTTGMVFDPEGLIIGLIYKENEAVSLKYKEDNMTFYLEGKRIHPLSTRLKETGMKTIEVHYRSVSCNFVINVE